MKTEQRQWTADGGWVATREFVGQGAAPQIVFVFGGAAHVQNSDALEFARHLYPNACVVGCTTAGEIAGPCVSLDSVVMTAVEFAYSSVVATEIRLESIAESSEIGTSIMSRLPHEGLRHVVVFSDGLKIDGSALVASLKRALPRNVTATGGFAGDGDRMQTTQVWCNGQPQERTVVAIGFYGERLQVDTGVTGPWGPFGSDRLVTKSRGNTLFELDGRPALDLYKDYLGEHAAALPASGLLFPLLVHAAGSKRSVLRALIGVNESEGSITFAGDVPQGAYVRLMRGRIEALIEDAGETAAAMKRNMANGAVPGLALLVSCNGRRHVLKQRIDEEIEVVDDALGAGGAITGFYSYGEIGPVDGDPAPELHNETLAITTLSEM